MRIFYTAQTYTTRKFELIENYEINRRILKRDFIRYSPAETSTINTPNSQIYTNILREYSVTLLLHS